MAWVWNRSIDKLLELPEDEMLEAKVFEYPILLKLNSKNLRTFKLEFFWYFDLIKDLEDIGEMPKRAELIVEVAHPSLWKTHTETLLSQADVIVGSPSGKIWQLGITWLFSVTNK